MDEISPLLGSQPQESPDLLSPNLRPRHQELIPTPCGPIKSWSELSCLLKLYFCFTIASLLALLGLTLNSIYKQRMETDVSDEDNLTVSLIQLLSILFCIYYISRGVLQENRQELVAFVLSVLVVMIRSVVNFSVQGSKGKQELLVRFVCIMCLGVVHVFCTSLLIQRPNMMAFRVGGALETLQEQYFLLNLCFSMVTFDLQAQLCLCILITTSDSAMFARNSIILGVGVVWACLTAAVGAVAVLKEAKVLVWVFMVQNLPQVAFFVYLMYTVAVKWFADNTYTLEAAAVTGALISLVIKLVLFWGLIRLVHSFGQGLRERMFAASK
ncbi:uncharacterized protein LOC108890945 isoform X6 [Lates calcarifer]|uniref:Uncharacterized protein LOC108882584 n=2 Tax=Lates calcarifer TaxID=8187 RepID=A0A4W6BKK8_LATCA|nr:uncharacterized protein LOC108882584 [Lates calcarifer]XP_018543550.1 uncharacterized protein LOC108890945 isoform X2 [Lates calcarifer]XP_050923594.1 uncharacterized protein LOC108890945 isoform X1 [Lates calcarifer]XP_050923595.1 uncharacterized protein LOC108890945 isoform X3 [Lates calcarifer]XP_050923596.1 uncharacterized protein LOC108890945 isoform X4 [Lates calcarifer]XP_050923597.1 uncharacterized protein LOC108890945 isoform X5 [Lates calcarifer]XP_050923598.1 uncharacterized pro